MALSRPPAVFSQLKSPENNSTDTTNSKVLFRPLPAGARDDQNPMTNSSSDYNGKMKIVLQPRVCTLRRYGGSSANGIGGNNNMMIYKIKNGNGNGNGEGRIEVSTFFATLSDYIESSKKSQDFEIIFGRLAMIVFAATVTVEIVTGNSLFRKMEMEGIAEAVCVCVGAVGFAAIFAWFSSARNKVGTIFNVNCNTFIDSLIDQIIDGLFYEDPNDRSDHL